MKWAAGWVFERFYILCFALILLMAGLYVHDQQVQHVRNQRSVCSAFEAYTNALIGSGAASKTPDEKAKRQAQTDAFQHDLETRLGPLNCHFRLIPAR